MRVENGVDIVDINRIAKLVQEHGTAFISRTYTELEVEYCKSRGSETRRVESLAAMFAAKEAVSKALGTGLMTKGVGLKDIEVYHEESGKPRINLYGCAQEQATYIGVVSMSISISHDGGQAVAMCTILCEQ